MTNMEKEASKSKKPHELSKLHYEQQIRRQGDADGWVTAEPLYPSDNDDIKDNEEEDDLRFHN